MDVSLIITTINKPNSNIKSFSEGCKKNNWDFIVIGDKKTPENFNLTHGNYFNTQSQKKLNLKFANICPYNSYARKNIGYLIAFLKKSNFIVETDDDNGPKKNFFKKINLEHKVKSIKNRGWINIYDFFLQKKVKIWPRGLPLDEIQKNKIILENKLKIKKFFLQQGVADGNPDVDAIFRLLNSKIKIKFKNTKVSLSKSISPFNSQNTIWHKNIFELMYLPVTCPMRCTDIWRSLITLKIMQLNNLDILFYGTNIFQSRNLHNLMDDFYEEVPLYLESKKIIHILNKIKLKKGFKNFSFNIYKCYEILIKNQIFNKTELTYLKAWLDDCKKLI
tara:strand:- start:2348 stop:3349 length:1002 start_codon:yes stop_codon:yes gene_type:complete